MYRLPLALTLALAFVAAPAIAKPAKAKKISDVAHPHLTMLKLRLGKYLPPGQDKSKLGDIDLSKTVAADGTILRHRTIDFLVRSFGAAVAMKVGMEDVAGMMETLPPIDSPDAAQSASTKLGKISSRALKAEINREKRLAVAQMIRTLRSITKRAAEEESEEGLSAKQRYTRDSFEADKLGDDVQKLFRATMDASLDSEEDGLGALVEAHLRALTEYARPEMPAPEPKKKKKKRKKSKKRKR